MDIFNKVGGTEFCQEFSTALADRIFPYTARNGEAAELTEEMKRSEALRRLTLAGIEGNKELPDDEKKRELDKLIQGYQEAERRDQALKDKCQELQSCFPSRQVLVRMLLYILNVTFAGGRYPDVAMKGHQRFTALQFQMFCDVYQAELLSQEVIGPDMATMLGKLKEYQHHFQG